MPEDTYAKFMLRAHDKDGRTTIGVAGAKEALAALRNLQERGMISVTVSDRKGQSWSVADLQTEIGSDEVRSKWPHKRS